MHFLKTDQVRDYVKAKIRLLLASNDESLRYPMDWSFEFLSDCNHAAFVIAYAIRHPVHCAWDVRRYAENIPIPRSVSQENFLSHQFPPIYEHSHLEDDPRVVLDHQGNIFFWYLPGLLTPIRKQIMWDHLFLIEDHFDLWSTGHRRTQKQKELKPGCLDVSPAWFEQETSAHKHLTASPILSNSPETVQTWMSNSSESHTLIGGLLGVLQPELYELGKSRLFSFVNKPGPSLVARPGSLSTALTRKYWNLPFTAISIISQHQTPLHRDVFGPKEWMGILVALGKYDHGWFELPDLNMTFKYNPGCLVVFSGSLLQHKIDCLGGQHACIAFYMDKEYNLLSSPFTGYTNIQTFQE